MAKKPNLESYQKCISMHGEKYKYEATNFELSEKSPNLFICPTHGEFKKSIRDFLRANFPCEECLTEEKIARRKKNLKEGFLYDLTNFEIPEGEANKVTCMKHGAFQVTRCDHKRHKSGGCNSCDSENSSARQRMPLSEFINKAMKVHAGKNYDYSKVVEFKNQHQPVLIGCSEKGHGYFYQIPSNHIHKTRPQGCPTCGKLRTAKKLALSFDSFLEKANLLHGTNYDYSRTIFSSTKDITEIKCNSCQRLFEQTINDHLSGYGCMNCGIQKTRNANIKLTTELVVEKCREVWGDQYDYSKVKWESDDSPITIICSKHGEISIDYQNHVGLMRGCRYCGSKRRQKQNDWLDFIGLPNSEKHREVTIRFKSGGYCFADGFDSELNVVYEFNGDYFHGNPKKYPADLINRFSGRTMKEELERTLLKKQKLIESGFLVVDIWESDWDALGVGGVKKTSA